MRSIPVLIGAAFLIAAPGFTEILITAEDYAVDSDVVLESAVKEIKSAPRDTVNVIGDGVKYVADETVTAAKGVAAVFKKDQHANAQKAGELAVANAWDSSNDVLFRSYKVSEEVGRLLLTGAGTGEEGPAVDVSDFFSDIKFSGKTSAYYQPKLNRLFVRQTLENILAIENLLAGYQGAQRELFGHQVEIETKFLEVSQNTLNELGFDWNVLSKSGGDLNILDNLALDLPSTILSGGLRSSATALSSGVTAGTLAVSKTAGSLRWNMTIKALEQATDSDMLCAPRVVTRDGTAAIIHVGEEQMLPKAFDVNNSDVNAFVEHTDWDLTQTGVTMEVTPELREEGQIDLEINAKILDMLGQDSYVVSEGGLKEKEATYVPTKGEVTGLLPYLRIREMKTRVTVADGSTVGMGGLIYDKLETFRDKVPLLGSIPLVGRLFRSEGEKSVKRNLMIFVTATQVDVDGRRSADLALRK